MINTLSTTKIKKLQDQESSPSISIYLPVQPGHENADKNRIAFKNSLRVVKRIIQSNVIPASARRDNKWELQARNITNNPRFWESQSRGLAVFISNNNVWAFRINHTFENRVFVGIKFMTEPLVYVENHATQAYFVLALSKNATRLFEFSEKSSKEIFKSVVPHDLSTSLDIDEPNKGLQTHMIGIGGSNHSEAFHGQGYYKDQRKKLLEKFLRKVADSIQTVLAKKTAPLYVVGTSTIVAKYSKLNRYKQLAHSNIHMNVDYLDAKNLRQLLVAGEGLEYRSNLR